MGLGILSLNRMCSLKVLLRYMLTLLKDLSNAGYFMEQHIYSLDQAGR